MDDENQDSNGYISNGKIMISSIAILFIACFVTVSFHVYARWFRRRPVHHHNHRRRRINATSTDDVFFPEGLDLHVMNSLPTFIYESKGQESTLECAVCLSEFEDSETGRVLPECNHCFHVDCIDMWLQSHRDCPLCRAQVKDHEAARNPIQPVVNPDQIILSIYVLEDTDSGSNTGLHATCQSDGIQMGCSSSSPTLDVAGQLASTTGQDPTKNEDASNSDPALGSDIESGPKTTGSSVRILKRLFSI